MPLAPPPKGKKGIPQQVAPPQAISARKSQKMTRDTSVRRLAELVPSAIYLKIVWAHFVRWRDEKIDGGVHWFLNQQKSFRGKNKNNKKLKLH